MSGKVWTFSNGICKRYFFIMRSLYIKLQSYRLCYRQTQYMQKIHVLLSQGLYVPSVKTTTYVCNRFITLFCTKDHEHTRLYPATHYCTRLQRVKERIALKEAKGYFSFWSWSTTIFHCHNNLVLIYDVLSSSNQSSNQ